MTRRDYLHGQRGTWQTLSIALFFLLGLHASACSNRDGAHKKDAAEQRNATNSSRGEVLIAGASDLVFVMKELIPIFEELEKVKVKFSPGSSGKLAAQLREGAPYDAFFSANEKFVDQVVAAGVCDKRTKRLYALGRIVMWAGPDSQPTLPRELKGLLRADFRKIAIANPSHAPYGTAAKQALQRTKLWNPLKPRIVFGSNVKDTMQFAATGNAEVAIIALSLAKKSKGRHVAIPEEGHAPIKQAMVACRAGRSFSFGKKFLSFLGSSRATKLMRSYGFALPFGSEHE